MIQPEHLETYLRAIAETLDITPSMYALAVERYETLGQWVQQTEAAAGRRPSEVFPQGSVRIGTAVRPITDSDTLDVDLVHERDLTSITPRQLKSEAGDLLKRFVNSRTPDARPVLTERPRCWRLTYDDVFYMDVLPAIPNRIAGGSRLNITDRELGGWIESDPKAYANWFWQCMKEEADAARAQIRLVEGIENVPDWRVKTTLQRVVQILKRHRDVYFQADSDSKPASIVLTTVSAKAYPHKGSLLDSVELALLAFARLAESTGVHVALPNPVLPHLDLIDSWRDDSARVQKVAMWLRQARGDFAGLRAAKSFDDVQRQLSRVLGEGTINEAWARVERGGETQQAPVLITAGTVPGVGNSSHALSPLWPVSFDGSKVRVSGAAYKDRRASQPLWRLSSDRELPKNLELRFEATTNARSPYEVQWQVANTGKEAQAAGQLRGGFEPGSGQNGGIRWESTAYRGTHWVEAFVVRSGVLVARSGPFRVRVR